MYLVHVFIIGSKGIPAKYGGFETFVDKLTKGKKNINIKYHVSCSSDKKGEFEFNGVRCFKIKTPKVGSAGAIIYDILSLINCYSYIKKNNLNDCIIYILACRIGPFLFICKHKLEKHNIKVYVNPDGHEWLRSKWNKIIKMYWKVSEKIMIKCADLVICDSKAIESYINNEYSFYNKTTTFIPYGADIVSRNKDCQMKFAEWKNKFKIKDAYYLIVGRFVPENNFELIIKEFIASNLEKDLIIITNVIVNNYYKQLQKRTSFYLRSNIKFIGTVYDQSLLSSIRQNAFAYIHGHEVGGTNPSLLEGMASTNINILLDVAFNREVACNSALYFNKGEGSLTHLLHDIENLTPDRIKELGDMAKERIRETYSWNKIINQYELLFYSCSGRSNEK